MELWASLMERVTVPSVWELNAIVALNQCLTLKHITLMFVDTHALKMDLGKKEYIPEFIEITKSFKQ